jgi:cytochrome c-type biogenesis protein CcmH
MRRFLLALAMMVMALPALAVQPDEILQDPALEARARALSAGLRCLVCQNQSIDDSDAPLAKDLRILIRERLTAGDSDSQVVDFVVARYGEFVLLRPRFEGKNLLLWLGPFALLILAAIFLWRRRKTSPAAAEAPLTDQEMAELRQMQSKDR